MKARVSSTRLMLSSHGNHSLRYWRFASVMLNSSSVSRNSSGVRENWSEIKIDCMPSVSLACASRHRRSRHYDGSGSDYTRGMGQGQMNRRQRATRGALGVFLLLVVGAQPNRAQSSEGGHDPG